MPTDEAWDYWQRRHDACAREQLAELRDINRKLGKIMTAQDDVNAAVAALTAFLADIASPEQTGDGVK